MLVKIGPKGKHLDMPKGWHKVESGNAEKGDQFANLMTYKWQEVDEEDIGYSFDCFDHLIRKD